MAFVVDGADWCFDGWSADRIGSAIDNLLDRVRTARERNETVWIGDDLQTRPVLDTLDLWSLFSPAAPIQLLPELWQELSAWLGTALRYADAEEWPDGAEEIFIRVDYDSPVENADVAWAHHHVRAGRAVACLSLVQSGPHETISSRGSATVHWVQNEASHRGFWRAAIDVEGNKEEVLQRLAPHAFPDLHFHNGVWGGLKNFAGGYFTLSYEIRRYLAVLNDNGNWVFTFPPPALSPGEAASPATNSRPSNQLIERRFLGLKLTMAPENPDVFNHGPCRRAREIKIGKCTLYCTWHGKLEPHRNRMYVHPPVPESNGKVIIGILHEHLPLPGN